MSDLDEVFAGHRSRAGGCPVCGEPMVAQVGAQIRRLIGSTTSSKKGDSRTRSVNLCAEHAAEFWGTMTALVEGYRRGTSSG